MKADVRVQSVHPGDVFLLCSDGLTAMLDDEDIEAIVKEAVASPETLTSTLVAAANQRGGHDNITVITGHFNQA